MTNTVKHSRKRKSTNTYNLSSCGSYYDVTMSNGIVFMIDVDDYAYVSSFNWYIKGKNQNYPVRDKTNADTGYYLEYNQIYLAYDLMDVYTVPRASKGPIAIRYSDDNSLNLRRANMSFTTKQEVAMRMIANDDVRSKRRTNMNIQRELAEKQNAQVNEHLEKHNNQINSVGWQNLTAEDVAKLRQKARRNTRDWSTQFDIDKEYFTRFY